MGAQAPRRHPPVRPLSPSKRAARPRLDARRAAISRATGIALLIPLAILGGTFDPVHYGHLRLADDVAQALAPVDVVLVPASDPPHRDAPHAVAADRVAMLRLALAQFPRLALDTREIARGGKSYTVDTLAAIRRDMPARSLLLLVGADAFLGLPTWHRWRHLFDLAHIVVVPRPGVTLDATLPGPLASQWDARSTTDAGLLRSRAAGSIYVQPVTAQPISSTAIRAALAGGHSTAVELAGLLPAAVLAYIESNRLYIQPR